MDYNVMHDTCLDCLDELPILASQLLCLQGLAQKIEAQPQPGCLSPERVKGAFRVLP